MTDSHAIPTANQAATPHPTASDSAGKDREDIGSAETDNDREETAALRDLRRAAARQMGQATSERKRVAVRVNGQKGGRPRGSRTSPEAKARMGAAQRQRRAQEQERTEREPSEQEHSRNVNPKT